MIFPSIILLLVTALLSWWLSGFDKRVTGEFPKNDIIIRSIRCGLTLLLVEYAFLNLAHWALSRDLGAGITYLACCVPLVFLWAGCLGECFAHGFTQLLDPMDRVGADAGETQRDLDRVAALASANRTAEAVELCRELKQSGRASGLAMDAMLERLGAGEQRAVKSRPMAEIRGLRASGQFQEAEASLKSLLEANPADLTAALLLMQVYALDLHRPDQAAQVLNHVKEQPCTPSAFIEFARRSLVEWSQRASACTPANAIPGSSRADHPPDPAPEPSIDDLLANGCFGTAIETLERKVKEQPGDFVTWLKMAEVHGRYCKNLHSAEKVVERMRMNSTFTPDEIRQVKLKIKEWRADLGPVR
jgi:hypothetical protein